MASIGELTAKISLDTTGFIFNIKAATQNLEAFKEKLHEGTSRLDGIKNVFKNVQESTSEATNTFSHFANKTLAAASSLGSNFLNAVKDNINQLKTLSTVVMGISSAFALSFGKKAIDSAAELEKALTTLSIVAPRFGVKAQDAIETAKRLGKELRIGVSAAAEGLQNLLSTGLNLDQAADLLKRFTNEAITGKSANISLSDAVKNLSFAYKTQNSALSNMSGISENFSDIQEMGLKILQAQGQLLGKSVNKLSDAEKMQAQYAGMIHLTNLTMGSAEEFQGTYLDNMALLESQIEDLSQTIGRMLLPVLNELLKFFVPLMAKTESFIKSLNLDKKIISGFEGLFNFIKQNKDMVIAAFTGIAAAIAALGASSLLNPIILSLGAIGAASALLYKMYTENWGGMRDVVKNFVTFFQTTLVPGSLEAFQKITEGLSFLKDWFEQKLGPSILVFGKNFIEFFSQDIPAIFSDLKTKFDQWWSIFGGFFQSIQNAWNDMMNRIKPQIDELGSQLVKLWEAWRPIIELIAKALGVILVGVITQLIANFSNLISFIMRSVPDIIGMLSGVVKILESIANLIVGIFTFDSKKIESGLKGLLDGIVAILKGSINILINMLNTVIDNINNVLISNLNKIPGTSISTIPKIPRLASGTSFFKGGVAMVGENGPELVFLPKGTKVLNNRETSESAKKNIVINNYFSNSDDAGLYINRLNFYLKKMM